MRTIIHTQGKQWCLSRMRKFIMSSFAITYFKTSEEVDNNDNDYIVHFAEIASSILVNGNDIPVLWKMTGNQREHLGLSHKNDNLLKDVEMLSDLYDVLQAKHNLNKNEVQQIKSALVQNHQDALKAFYDFLDSDAYQPKWDAELPSDFNEMVANWW